MLLRCLVSGDHLSNNSNSGRRLVRGWAPRRLGGRGAGSRSSCSLLLLLLHRLDHLQLRFDGLQGISDSLQLHSLGVLGEDRNQVLVDIVGGSRERLLDDFLLLGSQSLARGGSGENQHRCEDGDHALPELFRVRLGHRLEVLQRQRGQLPGLGTRGGFVDLRGSLLGGLLEVLLGLLGELLEHHEGVGGRGALLLLWGSAVRRLVGEASCSTASSSDDGSSEGPGDAGEASDCERHLETTCWGE
mmetsp:Transcript_16860/g.36286  ORF Transcript_16860/g.36286 Transcript_16860/m.36286 type:complete len:245 (-) Transcript_16860:29-763(-)